MRRSSRSDRISVGTVLLIVALTAIAAFSAGCAKNRPALEPDAVPVYNRLEAVRIVNDIGDVAIAANEAGKLSDPATARALTIGWQVRDFIEANPTTTYTRIAVAIREALDATPPDVRAQIQSYLDTAIAALTKLAGEVQ